MRARAEARGDPQWVETRQLQEALSRSLAAETQVQAEVTLLRERTAQLAKRLEEQRLTFTQGVQQMLRPVQDYFASRRQEMPFERLIPELLRELETRPVPSEVPGVSQRDLEEVAKRLGDVRGAVHSCIKRLDAVEQLMAERLPVPVQEREAYDSSPQTYDTFVMSDRQAADIERAILGAQTRTGRPYGG